jgi:hypothetical protein
MYLQMQGIFLYTTVNKEMRKKCIGRQETSLMRKHYNVLVQTKNERQQSTCIVTGGGLSIGEFYNIRPLGVKFFPIILP